MCGIFAYTGKPPIPYVIAAATGAALRGPHAHGWIDAAGHLEIQPGRLTREIAETLPRSGPLLGHCRLSTSGRTCAVAELAAAQPLLASPIALAHNGVIRNWSDLADSEPLRTDNDSEALAVYLRRRLQAGDSPAEAIKQAAAIMDPTSPHAIGLLWQGGITLCRLTGRTPAHPIYVLRGDSWTVASSRPFLSATLIPADSPTDL